MLLFKNLRLVDHTCSGLASKLRALSTLIEPVQATPLPRVAPLPESPENASTTLGVDEVGEAAAAEAAAAARRAEQEQRAAASVPTDPARDQSGAGWDPQQQQGGWAAEAADESAAAAIPPEPQGKSSASGIYLEDATLDWPKAVEYVPRVKRQPLPVEDALQEVKAAARAKFVESVDIALKLGTDPRRGDQIVRGAASLPYGTGKGVRVCVFVREADVELARASGADVVGTEDLIATIAAAGSGAINFDKCVATPDMMRPLAKIARILGPRGLMPSPKLGTVVTDIQQGVSAMRQGRVEYRADRGAVVHASLGRVTFPVDHLHANLGAFVAAIMAARPKGLKGSGMGGYILSAHVSSTMGRALPVALPAIVKAIQTAKKGSEQAV